MLTYGQYRHLRQQPSLQDWQRQLLSSYEVLHPYASALLEHDAQYRQVGPYSMWSLQLLCLWAQCPEVGQLILSLHLKDQPQTECSPCWVLCVLKAQDRKRGVNWIWQLQAPALLAELGQARQRLRPKQRRALAARLVELGPLCPYMPALIELVPSSTKLLRVGGLSLLKAHRPQIFESPSVKFVALWLSVSPRPLEIIATLDRLTQLSLLTLSLRSHPVQLDNVSLLKHIYRQLEPTLTSTERENLAVSAAGGAFNHHCLEEFKVEIITAALPFVINLLSTDSALWLGAAYFRQSVPLVKLLLSLDLLDWELAEQFLFQNDHAPGGSFSVEILKLMWPRLPAHQHSNVAEKMLASSLVCHPNLEVLEFLLPLVRPHFKINPQRWPGMLWRNISKKFYLEPAQAAAVIAQIRTYIEPQLRPAIARAIHRKGYYQAALAL